MEAENLNFTAKPPCPYDELYWIISEILIALVAFLLLYFFCVLSIFALKQKLKKEMKILLYLAIVSVGFGIGRVISDEIVAFLGWQKDSFCVYSVSFSVGLYYLSFVAVYIFLWTRQNFFYQKPLLRHLVNKKLKWVSRLCLGVLVILGLAVQILFQIPEITGWDYRATLTGCRDRNDQQDFELIPFFLVIVTVIGQIALLGLLLYPFVATQNRRKRFDTGSQLWIPRPPSPKQDNALLRRAVLASYQEKLSISADISHNLRIQQQQTGNDFSMSMHQLCQSEDEVFTEESSGKN